MNVTGLLVDLTPRDGRNRRKRILCRMTSRRWLEVLALAALVAGHWAWANRLIQPVPYGYDEADYLRAASMGFAANYTDANSISMGEFVELGLGAGRDATRRSELSSYIRTRGDALFLRHWHGPLYYFPIIAAEGRLAHDEQAMHRLMLGIPALTFLLVWFGLRSLLPGVWGYMAGGLFGFLYLFSNSSLRTAAMLAPHSLFVLWCLAVAILLAKFVDTGRLRYWYGAVAACALALATLEVGVVLVLVLAGVCVLERRRVFREWRRGEWLRFGAQSAGLLAAVLTAVWPAAIFRLSLVKAGLFMAYLSVFRKAAWGDVTFANSWGQRLAASPAEWLFLAAALAVFVRWRSKLRVAVPALLVGAVMLASVLRVVSADYRYMTVYLPAFHLFGSVVLAHAALRFGPWRAAAVTLACAVLLWNSNRQVRPWTTEDHRRAWAIIDLLRAEDVAGKRVLVPGVLVPAVQFYFPQTAVRGYGSAAEANALKASRNFDAILVTGPEPVYVRL